MESRIQIVGITLATFVEERLGLLALSCLSKVKTLKIVLCMGCAQTMTAHRYLHIPAHSCMLTHIHLQAFAQDTCSNICVHT